MKEFDSYIDDDWNEDDYEDERDEDDYYLDDEENLDPYNNLYGEDEDHNEWG